MNGTEPQKETTPLMLQYEELKKAHPDEILLFRLGDFYEMFGEDAKKASPVLEVALTKRQNVPMCGMPYHAAERYIAKLLKAGLRVAVAEQMEDPATAKGIVKRDVVRMISSGTILEENLLSEKSNNFLCALTSDVSKKKQEESSSAVAALDISTGELSLMEIASGPDDPALANELARIGPAEILLMEHERVFPDFSRTISRAGPSEKNNVPECVSKKL